jgi:hypothetical protein
VTALSNREKRIRRFVRFFAWLVIGLGLGLLPLLVELVAGYTDQWAQNREWFKWWILSGSILLVAAGLAAAPVGTTLFNLDERNLDKLKALDGPAVARTCIAGVSFFVFMAAALLYGVVSQEWNAARETAIQAKMTTELTTALESKLKNAGGDVDSEALLDTVRSVEVPQLTDEDMRKAYLQDAASGEESASTQLNNEVRGFDFVVFLVVLATYMAAAFLGGLYVALGGEV